MPFSRPQLRSDARGQAAVESAIAIPLSMFVVLGILQMGMLQQARLLADYAAYRGTRTASVQRLKCDLMVKSELAALVPSLGRADQLSSWLATFETYQRNKYPSAPGGTNIVVNHWTLENVRTPFDKPLQTNEEPERVSVHLRYYYRMEIPFANWVFAKYFLAFNGVQAWATSADPLMEARKFRLTGTPPSNSETMQDFAVVKSYFNQHIYVAPIYASWTMRMFSQADTQGGLTGDCQ